MNLNQVTVSVADIERSIAFYESLGLKLIVRALPHYARFECPSGDATFSIHLAEAPLPDNGTWVYFEVDNLDETVSALLTTGLTFEEEPADKPWLWREARLRDPDRNLIILYYAGSNRKDPPWKIG